MRPVNLPPLNRDVSLGRGKAPLLADGLKFLPPFRGVPTNSSGRQNWNTICPGESGRPLISWSLCLASPGLEGAPEAVIRSLARTGGFWSLCLDEGFQGFAEASSPGQWEEGKGPFHTYWGKLSFYFRSVMCLGFSTVCIQVFTSFYERRRQREGRKKGVQSAPCVSRPYLVYVLDCHIISPSGFQTPW